MLHSWIKSWSCSLTTCIRRQQMSVWKRTLSSPETRRKRNKSIIQSAHNVLRVRQPEMEKLASLSNVGRTAPPKLQCEALSTACLFWMRRNVLKSSKSRLRLENNSSRQRALKRSRPREEQWLTSSTSPTFWSSPRETMKCSNRSRNSWLSKKASSSKRSQWCRSWWLSRLLRRWMTLTISLRMKMMFWLHSRTSKITPRSSR